MRALLATIVTIVIVLVTNEVNHYTMKVWEIMVLHSTNYLVVYLVVLKEDDE